MVSMQDVAHAASAETVGATERTITDETGAGLPGPQPPAV
jgi:hypothetical protein